MKKRKAITLLFYCAIVVFIQVNKNYSQNSDPQIVQNCEENIARLDIVTDIILKSRPEKKIILVANLGKKEHNLILNEKRLYSITKYLNFRGVKFESMVTTFGEKNKGLGGVGIYVEGETFLALFSEHNKSIKVGYCESESRDNKLFQLQHVDTLSIRKKYGRF